MTRAATLATLANNTSTTAGVANAIVFPTGTTAERPATPSLGITRYNTTTNSFEYYNGSSWVNL